MKTLIIETESRFQINDIHRILNEQNKYKIVKTDGYQLLVTGGDIEDMITNFNEICTVLKLEPEYEPEYSTDQFIRYIIKSGIGVL